MAKHLYVLISGGDYSAMNYEQLDKATKEEFDKTVLEQGRAVYDDEDYIYIEGKLCEFGDVDPSFVQFVQDELLDYDHMKDTNFYHLKTIEELGSIEQASKQFAKDITRNLNLEHYKSKMKG